jgi:hypothetical protein
VRASTEYCGPGVLVWFFQLSSDRRPIWKFALLAADRVRRYMRPQACDGCDALALCPWRQVSDGLASQIMKLSHKFFGRFDDFDKSSPRAPMMLRGTAKGPGPFSNPSNLSPQQKLPIPVIGYRRLHIRRRPDPDANHFGQSWPSAAVL